MRVFFFKKKTCASNYLTGIQVNSVHVNKLKHKLLSYYIPIYNLNILFNPIKSDILITKLLRLT